MIKTFINGYRKRNFKPIKYKNAYLEVSLIEDEYFCMINITIDTFYRFQSLNNVLDQQNH